MKKTQTPLRETIYRYLKTELGKGSLQAGSFIDMKILSEKLNISKTPLRDALILLEADGIVTIYPRRGVIVNPVSLEDIRNLYEICAGLESVLLYTVFEYIAPYHIKMMQQVLEEAKFLFTKDDFSQATSLNLKFHHIFRSLSSNTLLKRQLDLTYDRLYYFPPRELNASVVRESELNYWREHDELLSLIKKGARHEAANYLRDVHWTLDEGYAQQLHVLESIHL